MLMGDEPVIFTLSILMVRYFLQHFYTFFNNFYTLFLSKSVLLYCFIERNDKTRRNSINKEKYMMLYSKLNVWLTDALLIKLQ